MFRIAVHTLVLSSVLSLAFLGAPACGGGGGGGGGGQSLPVYFSGVYQFSIDDTDTAPPFNLAFTMNANSHRLSFSPGPMGASGTYDTAAKQWTFDPATSFDVQTDLGTDPLFGDFSIDVTDPLVIPHDAPPTSGEIRVSDGVFTAVLDIHSAGVLLAFLPDPATSYSWSELEDLLEAPGSTTEERIASFSVQLLKFVMERYDHVLDVLYALTDVSDFEGGYNPRSLTGAEWPTGYTLIPDTIENPGSGSMLWDDSNNFDDEVGMGDDFGWSAYELRPYPGAEYMYDGGIAFENLVATISPLNEVLAFGFRSIPTGGGGVLFGGMHVIQMDIDDGSMTVTARDTITLGGGFAIEFWKP